MRNQQKDEWNKILITSEKFRKRMKITYITNLSGIQRNISRKNYLKKLRFPPILGGEP